MKMTLDLLKELVEDAEFRSIPSMLSNQNTAGKPWWTTLSELKAEGAKATIWEGCQWIALLFDTYGDSIEKVSVNFNLETDKDEVFMTSSVYINGEHCFDGFIELEEHVCEACDAIDDSKVLNWVVGDLDNIGNSNLLSEMSIIDDAFKEDFTSAKQARDMARLSAPDINKWFVAKLLEKQVKEQAQERERVKGSTPKM